MSLRDDLRAYKVMRVRAALRRHRGNRMRASRDLGLHPTAVTTLIRRLAIDVPAGRAGRPPIPGERA